MEKLATETLSDGRKTDSARVSNTLAENTRVLPQTCCVDWVSCSFIFASDMQKIFNLIGIDDLENVEEIKGSRYEFAGYNVTYKLGFIELLHYKDDLGGCHWLLNMSGQGCRQFEISSVFDFPTLFAILANVDAVYTRLDIAIDDFSNIFTVNQFRQAVFNKQCVTRLKSWGNHQRGLIATGLDDVTMDSFYLGSSTSRFFINVYDKKMERLNKKIDIDKAITTWVRTEVRLSYEYADMFVVHIISDSKPIGQLIKAFLNEKVVFLKLSALQLDKNRSRLAQDLKNHARWWRDFINMSKKLHLTVYKPEKTLSESKDWIYDKVSTTLAMLHLYAPERYGDLIQAVTAEGLKKLKKKHERKILNQLYLDSLEKKKKSSDGQSLDFEN